MPVLKEPLAPTSVGPNSSLREQALTELEQGVRAALETYSNVHRGSGQNSLVSTRLFEQARAVILQHLGLSRDRYVVIACTPARAAALAAQLPPGSYRQVSSRELGLPLGVTALAVKRRALPRGVPFQSGGGTVQIVSPHWAIWAPAPDKFEAGTPATIPLIALARALQLTGRFGRDAFRDDAPAGQPRESRAVALDILYHDELEEYSGRELLCRLRQSVIGRGVRVPTAEGARPYINLDNGASTPALEPVWDAVCRTWRQPRPVQHEVVRETRAICARFLGAPPEEYEVLFTSNTTEALNLAAASLGGASEPGIRPVVLNTLLEHNSNELPWRNVPGLSLLRLPVDDEGWVDLEGLEALLRDYNRQGRHGQKRIRLVAVSGASNVLGTCNDLEAIGRIAHRYGARFLVDAAQLVAHRKVEMERCGVDFLAFSAHKAYAPFGSGALVVRKGLLTLSPAELETVRSSGEENAAGIAALGKVLVLLQRVGMDVVQEEERALTQHALRGLAQVPGIRIYGLHDPDSPDLARRGGVITWGLPDVPHNLAARELAEWGGIGVRNGCFCAHLLVKRLLRIHPLRARVADLGLLLFPRLTGAVLPGLVRVSLGLENSREEVDVCLQVVDKIARQPRSQADRLLAAIHSGTPWAARTEVQQQMNEFARVRAERVYLPVDADQEDRRSPDWGRAIRQWCQDYGCSCCQAVLAQR